LQSRSFFSSAHSATNASLSFLLPVSLSHPQIQGDYGGLFSTNLVGENSDQPAVVNSIIFAVKHETKQSRSSPQDARNEKSSSHHTPEYFRAR
jgi:hypothetical protein